MQLVLINGGRVSTCRGCDRQTHHPHIGIQLEVRRQKELTLLCADFHNKPKHLPPFSGSNTARYPDINPPTEALPLAHA